MIEKLRSIGAPSDVLREFKRSNSMAESHEQPEILDIDALMALDEMNEGNSKIIMNERDLKRKLA